jgi:plastocyanin
VKGRHLLAAAALVIALPPAAARADAPPLSVDYTAADISATNHQWYVTGTTTTAATVATGGVATFRYVSGSTRHNVTFTSTLKPTCEVAGTTPDPPYTAPSRPSVAPWTASCRFDAPGTYSFVCQVHRTMTGTIAVVGTSVPGSSGGSVPATLSLGIGAGASLGTFALGVPADYAATVGATVTSTAGNATLTAADPSPTDTGHLVNGAYALAQPLQLRASDAANLTTAFVPLPGADAPATLLSWAGPVSNDAVAVDFKQSIGATDPLRTGTYAKTVVLTLTTTDP